MIIKYLAIRLTWLLLLFALGYSFFLPSAGERQFARTERALAHAQSYRMEKTFHGPEFNERWLLEVVCPDREHSLQTWESNGSRWDTPQFAAQDTAIEDIDIGGQGYRRLGQAEWSRVQGQRGTYCGSVPFLQKSALVDFKYIRALGHIERRGLDTVAGETCQEWVVTLRQPNGTRKVFDYCINSHDDLPRRIKTDEDSFQIILTNWNEPIDIEAPEWSR